MNQRLILLTAGFPYGNGETFLENEIEYLADAFQEVEILCPKPPDNNVREIPTNCKVSFYNIELSKVDKIKALFGIFDKITRDEIKVIQEVYQLKFSKGILFTLLISLFQAKKIAKICRKRFLTDADKKSNTVFYSYWCDDTALALALLKKRNSKMKCVSRTHGWDVYFDVHPLKYLPFRQFISNNLTVIFPISEKGKSAILNVWKADEKTEIKVARLGVKFQLVKSLRKTQDVFTLVSCSNVIPLKRVEMIADAVITYEQSIQWIHFGDGILLESVKKKCFEKRRPNQEIFFKGRVQNEEVLHFYQTNHVDAFINVSTSEGIPVSIMEAMSFGTPCIATDVGGTSEIVNSENGVLLDENPNLKDIQTAFKSVLNDEAKRKSAYQTWEEKYNAQKNYSEFIETLVNLK